MYYVKSDAVKAFPLAKPRLGTSKDITSRIFYEQNVSNMIRQIIDVDGFIISGSVTTAGVVQDSLCFDIYGYYFELSNGTKLVESGTSATKVFALIKVSNTEPVEIEGQDESGEYRGLCFSDKLESGYKGFQLLEKQDGSGPDSGWRLVIPSYRKFDIDSLGIDWIDAKH